MSSWENLCDVGNVAQLAGVSAVGLIGLIVQAANSARLHKKNCRKFAHHLKLIGNLLEQLKISELKKYPETREPLEQLEDALRRAYLLVQSCQDKSYLSILAMGWSIVTQFKRAQDEIDRYLKIMPLLTLVTNSRFKERLERVERDHYEYTLDEEEREVQYAILNEEPSQADTILLEKSLSCSYPHLRFDEALQEEKQKLHEELQQSQSKMDVDQCQVIQHLIEVTEALAGNSKKMGSNGKGVCGDERFPKIRDSARETYIGSGRHNDGEWHTDLLGCCSDPELCMFV